MRARTRLLQALHSKDPEAIKQAKADAIKAGYSNAAVGAIGRTPSDVFLFSKLPEADQQAILRQANTQEFERYVTQAGRRRTSTTRSTSMTETDIASSNSLADLAARIRVEHEAAGRPRIWRGGTPMPKGWPVVGGSLMSREEENEMFGHMRAAGRLLIEAWARLSSDQWLLWRAEQCGISRQVANHYMELAWDSMPDDEAEEIDRRMSFAT